jgi:hypothetical protein
MVGMIFFVKTDITMIKKWWQFFSIAIEGWHVLCFWKALNDLVVTYTTTIEIFWLSQDWQLKSIFGCCPNVKKFFLVSVLTNVTYVSRQTRTWHSTQNGLVMFVLTTLTTSWGPNFFFFWISFFIAIGD